MRVKQLSVQNFRNIEKAVLKPADDFNAIFC